MTADGPTLDGELVRRLLRRRDLAAARHRAALARRLGLTDTEMLAVTHLAQHGQLTPSRLAALLDLSSGGVSALVQRLERAAAVSRRPHPTDGRSSLIRIAPEVAARVQRAEAALVGELERMAAGLDAGQRTAVAGFLTRIADLSEELAEPVLRELAPEIEPRPRRVPSLWA